jgi:hypothetical protein
MDELDSRPSLPLIAHRERRPEGLPMSQVKLRTRRPRCSGTVEDYRGLTFDVRDRALRNSRLLDLPPGYVLRNGIAWPWIRQIRTGWEGLEITLQNGRTERVSLVSVACGFAGSRFRLECPRCRRRVCKLYYVNARIVCRKCEGLWYAAQRTSSNGRKFLAMRKIRRKLGDYGQLRAIKVPPKPRGMWRRTYARHCAALARIERSFYLPRRR